MGKGSFRYETVLPVSVEDAWRFFQDAQNLVSITSFPKVVIESESRIKKGEELLLRLHFFPGLSQRWKLVIEEWEEGRYFVDVGIKLPFPLTKWRHRHQFEADPKGTRMVDDVQFEALVPSVLLQPMFHQMFRDREKQLRKLWKGEE